MMDQLSCFQTSPSVNELDKTVAGTSKPIPADDGSEMHLWRPKIFCIYIYIIYIYKYTGDIYWWFQPL